MLKVVFFDVYGTLISTGTGSVDAAKLILEKRNSDLDPRAFYSEWKEIHKRRMRAEGFAAEAEIFRRGLAELYAAHRMRGDPLTDVQPMLESLRNRAAFPETAAALERISKKYDAIAASNTDTAPLLQNFRHNHITLGKIYTSGILKTYKPNAAFYKAMLRDCGYSPEEVLFVGDSFEEDIEAPSRLGMETALVDRKNLKPSFGQSYTVNNLLELCELLGC